MITHAELMKMPVNEFLTKAAELLDDYLDPLPNNPQMHDLLTALREWSKSPFLADDIFAAKNAFDPGKG